MGRGRVNSWFGSLFRKLAEALWRRWFRRQARRTQQTRADSEESHKPPPSPSVTTDAQDAWAEEGLNEYATATGVDTGSPSPVAMTPVDVDSPLESLRTPTLPSLLEAEGAALQESPPSPAAFVAPLQSLGRHDFNGTPEAVDEM